MPQERTAAVSRGLREAFGVTGLEDIEDAKELTWGPNSNLVFRIVVQGSPFLLRINTRAGDLTRHFGCMKTAAEAGLAPRVWYSSVEDRVSITDFVQAVPFPLADALLRMPAVLRMVHALPQFPREPKYNTTCTFLLNRGNAVDGFFQQFRAAKVLPETEAEELLARYQQVAAVYPNHDPDMVSSHNDLFKPDNILFDGSRVWLVDWEAAFLNDRYADLAVVANLVVSNDAEEEAFLQEYFGKPPDEYQLARFRLMQHLAHMFYAMVFLLMGSSGKPIDWSETVPEFGDFQRRFWTGEFKLVDNHSKTIYGRVHWEQLLQKMRQDRFDEALRIISSQRKGV